jgi:uncharacterized membrane protein YfcA
MSFLAICFLLCACGTDDVLSHDNLSKEFSTELSFESHDNSLQIGAPHDDMYRSGAQLLDVALQDLLTEDVQHRVKILASQTEPAPVPTKPITNGTKCSTELQSLICGWKICRNGLCDYCRDDSECRQNNYRCELVSAVSDVRICRHSSLFSPLDLKDVWLSIGVFLVCFVSATSGTGGGGVLVLLLILLREMTPHEAVPLAKVMQLGTAIANVLVDMQLRHPHADRPLIDFETCAVLLPCQLIGTIVGVLLNAVIPEWALSLAFFLLLTMFSVSTTTKALTLYKEEAASASICDDAAANGGKKLTTPRSQQMIEAISMRESSAPPMLLAALLIVWFIGIGSALVKGSTTFASEARCGSIKWWLMTLLPIPISLVLLIYMFHRACKMTSTKLEIGYPFLPSDMKWDSRRTVKFPLMCTLAGISSGALGLGGGTVTSPLMLNMGLHPRVVAANAAFMILFTASSTSTQYLASGRVTIEYAGWFGLLGLVACLIGHIFMHLLMRRSRVTWHLVAVVAGIMIVSALGLGTTGAVRLIAAVRYTGHPIGIRGPCYYSP